MYMLYYTDIVCTCISKVPVSAVKRKQKLIWSDQLQINFELYTYIKFIVFPLTLPVLSLMESASSFLRVLTSHLWFENHLITLRSGKAVFWASCINVVLFCKQLVSNADFRINFCQVLSFVG